VPPQWRDPRISLLQLFVLLFVIPQGSAFVVAVARSPKPNPAARVPHPSQHSGVGWDVEAQLIALSL
jgi:hypothetical protein